MQLKLLANNKIKVELNIKFYKDLNVLYLKHKIGIIKIYLPKFYFYKYNENELFFIFLNNWFLITFFKQFIFFYKMFFKFYFFRIKLKGLGYRIRKMTKRLYRFFTAYNYYYYFHVAIDIFIWNKKRNLLALSNNKIKLNNIFYHLLYLKKLDFYERTNSFIVPKKILFIKK